MCVEREPVDMLNLGNAVKSYGLKPCMSLCLVTENKQREEIDNIIIMVFYVVVLMT